MVDRVTKTSVRRAFSIFTKEAGIPTSAKWLKTKRRYSKKFLKLDYNSHYGGFRMDWVFPNTSEDFFRGMTRRNTREMYNYLWGLIHARRMKRGGGAKKPYRKRQKK